MCTYKIGSGKWYVRYIALVSVGIAYVHVILIHFVDATGKFEGTFEYNFSAFRSHDGEVAKITPHSSLLMTYDVSYLYL